MKSLAMVPQSLMAGRNTPAINAFLVVTGAIGLSLLAQVAIPLPFTPVPLTGQTFGVTLIALLFGRKRGVATVGIYLGMGIAGLPVFSGGRSGFEFGPTSGYLIGMLFSSFLVGGFADRGWCDRWEKAYLAAMLGSLLVFAGGLLSLSFFVPIQGLLAKGLVPFIPGDLLKNLAASWTASRVSRLVKKERP